MEFGTLEMRRVRIFTFGFLALTEMFESAATGVRFLGRAAIGILMGAMIYILTIAVRP